jgi:hypothetical protein
MEMLIIAIIARLSGLAAVAFAIKLFLQHIAIPLSATATDI